MEIILIIIIAVSIFAGYTTGVMMNLKEISKKDNEIIAKDSELDKVTKERNELREYKQNVENIINLKATIVDKYDKIKEVITTANVK